MLINTSVIWICSTYTMTNSLTPLFSIKHKTAKNQTNSSGIPQRVHHTNSCVRQNRQCHSSVIAALTWLCRALFNTLVLLWCCLVRRQCSVHSWHCVKRHGRHTVAKQSSSYSTESFYIGPSTEREMVKDFRTVLISAPVIRGASLSIVNIRRCLLTN